MSFNLSVILRESARRNPEHPAVISDEGRMSYRELDAASNAVARSLLDMGLQPGQGVGLQLPNVSEFVVALHGVIKAGGFVIPINILNKAPEIEYFLSKAHADFIITDESCAAEAIAGARAAGATHVVVRGEAVEGTSSFAQLLEVDDTDQPAPFYAAEPTDTAVLMYTSGTTGRPKGVKFSHFQLFMNADAHRQAFQMGPDTVILAVMPLFHSLGLSGILNATVLAGGTVRLLLRFDAERVLEVIQEDGVTLLHGVPTMYHALMNHPNLEAYDTSTLSVCGSAGAAIASELIDTIEETLGVVVLEMYGLTESGPLATANVPSDRKPYSIGKPIWGTEAQIWDDDGNRLPRGKDNVGEVVLRGHNTMIGYLDDDAATEDAFRGGWLHTGDLGYEDEDGFFFIVGRIKELIIRGGYNVYPREVEDVLHQHEGLDEDAVVGKPDDRLGEEVVAVVSKKPNQDDLTEAEVIDFVKQRLAAYKYPREVIFVDELPKGPTGKILKRQLLEDL